MANLANDSGQWSRQLLQNVVDILTATVDGHVDALKGDAQDMFKDKYDDVVSKILKYPIIKQLFVNCILYKN